MVQGVRRVCIAYALAFAATASAAGIRDDERHPPRAVELPAAGGSYVDPVFGTRILRVTDESSGRICVHAYSYWSALNRDSTRLLLACDGAPRLFRFDGKTVTADGLLSGSDGPKVQFEGASWSNLSSNVIYALDGTRLWRLDVSRRGAAGARVVKDFSGLFDYPFVLAQLSMSGDDRVFSFHSRDPATGARRDAVAFDAETGEVRVFPRGSFLIDESKVAKNGHWVMVDGALGGFKMWDPDTGEVLSMPMGDADARPGGHADVGQRLIVNSDGWNTGLLVRDYDEMLGARNLKNIVRYTLPDGQPNWTLSDHVSLRSDAESFVVASTYDGSGAYNAFEGEIYLAFTDGSGFVRLAHTRSTETNPDPLERYWAQPRATVDRAGHWIVFTSDLGSSSRTDVLLLEIPSAYRPAATPTMPPPGAGDGDPEPTADPADPATSGDDPGPVITSAGARDDGVDALSGGCTVGPAARGAASWGWLLVVGMLISSRGRGRARGRSRGSRAR